MVAVGKLVWQIAQKKDVIWIKWIHSVYIREQTCWEYKAPPNASWIWKGVCKANEVFKAGYNNNIWSTGTKKYTAKEGYKWLKGQYETVGWHHWVWNGLNVPKHAFISWLVALGKVKTRDRPKAAGVCNDVACLLCNSGTDKCLHLFFRCHFSRIVCVNFMSWLQIKVENDECLCTAWEKWGRRYRSRKHQQICYSAHAATVYHIRRARNHSLWENAVLQPDRVVQCIKQEVVGRVKMQMKESCPEVVRNWVTVISS
ncbi:uncharacterized protein LOC104883491 [Beta vulgaris subsp. vulgaris]|uniref:uncharacterized protein LOC104883491 n=1 Tax=Beta vulgaris subsp. vulgaris TaxID=3555 RepID=UPI00053FC357|nr:uncharacterized protein LOC104883491 [Beta vulgaris subsp. vulgaris]